MPLPGPGPVTMTSGLWVSMYCVGAVALVADDHVHVGRISLGEAVGVDPDAPPLQLVLEDACAAGWCSNRVMTTPSTSMPQSRRSSISFRASES